MALKPGKEKEVTSSLTYSAYDVFMVREMRFAVLAAVNLLTVQINVVGEPHILELNVDYVDLS